jgi:hypothetical protein
LILLLSLDYWKDKFGVWGGNELSQVPLHILGKSKGLGKSQIFPPPPLKRFQVQIANNHINLGVRLLRKAVVLIP